MKSLSTILSEIEWEWLERSKLSYPEQYALHEGLILTQGIDKSIGIVSNSGFHVTNRKDNTFDIRIDSEDDRKKLITLTNNLGWYPAYIIAYPNDYKGSKYSDDVLDDYLTVNRWVQIRFEAKYDVEITDIPRFLYHYTLKKNLDSIMKKGLVPKDHGKRSHHPPRIYMAYSKDDAERLSKKMGIEPAEPKSDKFADRGHGVTLKIVTAPMPNYFKIYNDPNYDGRGCFTLNTIPPKFIKIDGEFIIPE